MNKNYRSTLGKWNAGLWNRLEAHRVKRSSTSGMGTGRYGIWSKVVWNRCGFCREFPDDSCRECPLKQDNHCSSAWALVPVQSVLRKIRNAWENDQPRTFEKYRLEFYNILKSYRDRFKED